MRKIMMNQSTLTIEKAFEDFITHCKCKNLSTATITFYQTHFVPFTQFTDCNATISSVTHQTLQEYVLFLLGKNLSPISVNSYLRGIRAFLHYCMDNGYCSKFNITLIKADKPVKPTYNDNELALLLKKPNVRECTFSEYKLWCFANFLLGTGIRLSSALDIKIEDLDLQADTVVIKKTKNRHQMILPISKTLHKVLNEYLTYRKGETSDYLFCNSYGNKWNMRTCQQMIADYNTKRGVSKTSAHLYRHTFAKNWIMNGGDIFRLQKMLGHSDISIVKEYVSMFGTDMQKDFDKFNPLDNIVSNANLITMKKR